MRSREEAFAEAERLLAQARAESLARAQRDERIARRLNAFIDFPFRYLQLICGLLWAGTVLFLALYGHNTAALRSTLLTAPMLMPVFITAMRARRRERQRSNS